MNRKTLGRIATLSLMLGISTIACNPGGQGHVASLAGQAPAADPRGEKAALHLAAQARAALAAHQGDAAVAAAEKAVALGPDDAGNRLLLGQSYLATGRFASAEASFQDSLTLSPDQPKARFDMALAEIAQGRGTQAQETLHSLNGAIPAGDVGLALALAGDRPGAIAMLTDLVRSGKSTPRDRQNLALAFALSGRWGEARAVAMQDTGPDKIEAQLAHWAELAKPTATGTMQVAAMLGVTPRVDPGVPSELALAPRAAAASVALAAPMPTAQPAPAAIVQGNAITVPLDAPIPVATPADAPAAAVVLAAETHARRAAMTPPPLLRAPASPARSAIRSAALLRPVHAPVIPTANGGGYVVQLGAYARAGAIQTAWSQASRLVPKRANLSAARAQFSFSGSSLVRLSVTGLADHASAAALCGQIRARGGNCFVRAVAGDARIAWARLDKPAAPATAQQPTRVAAKGKPVPAPAKPAQVALKSKPFQLASR